MVTQARALAADIISRVVSFFWHCTAVFMNLHCGLRQSFGRSNAIRGRWVTSVVARHFLCDASSAATNRFSSTYATAANPPPDRAIDVNKYDHLNPGLPDYSSTPFTDACTITLQSGPGGHGCISFLREKYIPNGPANGGDGGTGGNVYIQAVRGETSLHKIARRRMVKAGRGKNGQGAMRGGKRGDDVTIVVPVGTIVREVRRRDPVSDELAEGRRQNVAFGQDAEDEPSEDDDHVDRTPRWRRDRWLLYPGTLPKHFTSADFPPLPRPRRSNLALTAPPAPIRFDLDRPMAAPMLLAAGAVGGLGNPHFVTKSIPRPKFATKGNEGVTLELQLELKLLADVGLVGLPNAGKSTLLRALTSSRARVGDWAFTTLAPNIGTVVLDTMSGPAAQARRLHDGVTNELRTHFTIADIPGLIEGAHLDKGLGLDFLRHIERAAALAFVVDLSARDAVQALQGLWAELREYEKLRQADSAEDSHALGAYQPFSSSISSMLDVDEGAGAPSSEISITLPRLKLPPLRSKPWLVVATKADLPGSQKNFASLQAYLTRVEHGVEKHPSADEQAWRVKCRAVPVCAMKKENTEQVLDSLVELLQSRSLSK